MLAEFTHLPEDNLKLLSLSASRLPPVPRLTRYQRDVITLREQQ